MENRGFFFSWLNLYRIFIFLHQLRISHLTRLTLPGSLDHRISIWMFRRSPWSDSAKAEGGKPAKSSWRQWRMRDVLWMTCRHTSWRSEKKRQKWPWWLRLVTSTSSAKKSTLSILSFKLLDPSKKMGEKGASCPSCHQQFLFPVDSSPGDEPPNRIISPWNCSNHQWFTTLSAYVQSLYFANVAYDSTDDALRHRWYPKKTLPCPGFCMLNGELKNQWLEREGPKMAEVFFSPNLWHNLLKVKSVGSKMKAVHEMWRGFLLSMVPAQTVSNSIAHEISQPIRCRWF